jgi:hypothetical protein
VRLLSLIDGFNERLNVRYWHKADMLNALTNVRFWEQIGHLTNRCLPISIYEYTALVTGIGLWKRAVRP